MGDSFGKGHHLHLIDGSAYIFRAYHALPPLTRKSDGLPVGVQVMGDRFTDLRCLAIAQQIQDRAGAPAPIDPVGA